MQALESQTHLVASSGLSRPTVVKALTQLANAGWAPSLVKGRGARVAMPGALLADPLLGAQAKILFGILQAMSESVKPSRQFTYAGLNRQTGADLKTIRRAVTQLVDAGWLEVKQTHQLAPIEFVLALHRALSPKSELAKIRERITKAKYKGQAIMREFLSLLIDLAEYVDSARPDFLTSPATGERLELDRFYPPSVGFEFNGEQHRRPSDKFSAAYVGRRKALDYMKMGMCATAGVHLVTVWGEDLSLEIMKQKVGNLLPLRDLTGYEHVIRYLNVVGEHYGAKVPE